MLLCVDAAVWMVHGQLSKLLLHRARLQRLHEELVRCYSKRKLSQQDHAFQLHPKSGRLLLSRFQPQESRVSVEEFQVVCKKQLLPWLVACPSMFNTSVSYKPSTCLFDTLVVCDKSNPLI